MEKEIWKEVSNYSNYMISSRGRVKSMKFGKERVLKQAPSGGYLATALSKEGRAKTFYIHKLVAIAFLNHIPCGHRIEVNHIDGVKANNNLSNLELLTQEEHAIETWKSRGKTSAYTGVCWSKTNKKWKAQIRIEGKQKCIGHFEDEVSASEAYLKALTEAEK
mgnify:CR=1 FL=1|tara:strand:- start:71 stop:559 length:489 start_codon:yes stop_codon:yes gene_type:complete